AVFQLPSRALPPPRLPRIAFCAEIWPAEDRLELRAGEKAMMRVTVRNASPAGWPIEVEGRDTFLRLGNHWLDSTGELVAFDDGRVPLPNDVAPGKSATVELAVTAPGAPGDYFLDLDLVQEGTCWFAQQGSPATRVKVAVLPAAEPARVTDATGPLVP